MQSALKTIGNTGSYHTSFCLKGTEHLLDPHKQLITFRIAQESLTNIIKHAKADQIRVELSYCPDGLTLILKDNGVGFDPTVAAKAYTSGEGSGLDNIQYRARLIGAELKIESEHNQGTAVIFTLPNQP